MAGAVLGPVRRGMIAGIVLGLCIGGLALFAVGLRNVVSPAECAPGRTPAQCAWERETAVSFGRRQVWIGGALAMMGLAAIIFLRSRRGTAVPETPSP